MEVKKRLVAKEFWAWACPRCDNGTMAWERDKDETYLKCILCGKEVRKEKFYKNYPKKSQKGNETERESGKIEENKLEKRPEKSYKWQFIHAQK